MHGDLGRHTVEMEIRFAAVKSAIPCSKARLAVLRSFLKYVAQIWKWSHTQCLIIVEHESFPEESA